MKREPSKIRLGPDGTWPLRFDSLVQPILDRKCVTCHQASGDDPLAAKTDLSPGRARQTLLDYADKDLAELVFERDASIVGESPARQSKFLQYLNADALHRSYALTELELKRFAAWMDTYGHTQGAFSAEQEDQLREFREQYRDLFER